MDTFSARVMELHRPPFWNNTPKRRLMRSWSSGAAAHRFSPSIRTSPCAGGSSPIRCHSRVLLPLPLPPMMMKMSPRRTVKVRSRWITELPYAMVRSRTVMYASGDVIAAHPSALPHLMEDDRQEGRGDDNADDAGHHGRGGRRPDRRGAAAALQAA